VGETSFRSWLALEAARFVFLLGASNGEELFGDPKAMTTRPIRHAHLTGSHV
jgi:hypothetical protein